MTRLAAVKIERDEANRRANFAELALHVALTQRPDAIERFREHGGNGRYVVSAYRLGGPQGGIVVQRWICPGQADSVRAWLFDDYQRMHAHVDASTLPFRVACEHICPQARAGVAVKRARRPFVIRFAYHTIRYRRAIDRFTIDGISEIFYSRAAAEEHIIGRLSGSRTAGERPQEDSDAIPGCDRGGDG